MKRLVLLLLISAVSYADGPCGAGKYVYRCFPAKCGEPATCTMVCDGPSDPSTKEEKRDLIDETAPDENSKVFTGEEKISDLFRQAHCL
jgi:hypothetical protein